MAMIPAESRGKTQSREYFCTRQSLNQFGNLDCHRIPQRQTSLSRFVAPHQLGAAWIGTPLKKELLEYEKRKESIKWESICQRKTSHPSKPRSRCHRCDLLRGIFVLEVSAECGCPALGLDSALGLGLFLSGTYIMNCELWVWFRTSSRSAVYFLDIFEEKKLSLFSSENFYSYNPDIKRPVISC